MIGKKAGLTLLLCFSLLYIVVLLIGYNKENVIITIFFAEETRFIIVVYSLKYYSLKFD